MSPSAIPFCSSILATASASPSTRAITLRSSASLLRLQSSFRAKAHSSKLSRPPISAAFAKIPGNFSRFPTYHSVGKREKFPGILAKAAEIGGLLSFEECAFARNEDCSRRSDAELLRVIALVDGDTDAVARIDEQKGIADGDIHKSFHVGQHHRFLVDLELYRIAEVVSQLLEFIAWNIRDQRTEGIIERDNVTGDAFVGGGGCFRREADELRNFGAYKVEFPSGGEVRARGRKNVAAMEGRRNWSLNNPVGIGNLARGSQAVAIDHRRDQAIIGQNKILVLLSFDDDGFARGADSGVDDRHEDRSSGIVGRYAFQETRALFYGVRSHAMSDVHDAGVWRDAKYYRFADGHGVVGGAKVGHEDDDGPRAGFSGRGRVTLRRRLRAGRGSQGEHKQRQKEQTNARKHQRSVTAM